MATRSIYHKPCPSCAAAVDIEATHCRCGYSFDTDIPEADMLADDQQDQELLKEYLSARIAQAVDNLESVQTALATDPTNLDKAGRLMKAYVALHELRAELEALSESADTTTPAEDAGSAGAETATSQQATEAFRAAQAHKAEQIMKAVGMETKNCPKCRTVLPQRAALCFCGFAFASEAGNDPRRVEAASAVQLPIDR